MRDPARIDGIIAKLTAAWERHPDLRLGQLIHIVSVRGQITHDHQNTMPIANIFFVEDDKIADGLDILLRE